MSTTWQVSRRRLLATLTAVAGSVACTRIATAQDPRASIAQKAAREWLALADRQDHAAMHKAAGAKFRSAITPEKWAEASKAARDPLGPTLQRTLISTAFEKQFPGVPEGNYALLQFRTAFAKRPDSRETVTLEREPDGQWRVIGYFIR